MSEWIGDVSNGPDVDPLVAALIEVKKLDDRISPLVMSLVRTGNRALIEVNPEIARSRNELKQHWPLTNLWLARAALQQQFLESISRRKFVEQMGLRREAPLHVYCGNIKYWSIIEGYRHEGELSALDPRVDQDQLLPKATARFIQELALWTDVMASSNENIVTAVDLNDFNGVDVRLFRDSKTVQSYFEWRTSPTGTSKEIFIDPRHKVLDRRPDVWASERVIVHADEKKADILPYIAME